MGKTPSTLSEAIGIIRATFPEAELAAWANRPMDEAVLDAHFALGAWIRNEWIFDEESQLVKRIRESTAYIHDDDVSSLILEALWRVLNDEDCPSIERLLGFRYCGGDTA